jgi:hypothetical protein
VGLEQIMHAGDTFVDVGLAARRPEAIIDGDGADRNISQFCEGRFGEILDALILPRGIAGQPQSGLLAQFRCSDLSSGDVGKKRRVRQARSGCRRERRSYEFPARNSFCLRHFLPPSCSIQFTNAEF